VRQAAELCRTVQRTHLSETSHKVGNEPVTIADYGSQAILVLAPLAAPIPPMPSWPKSTAASSSSWSPSAAGTDRADRRRGAG
jgi:3'-phosphoadenosine 5'-phosphosulfate (PAPS) 3'-phosphatase